MRKFPLLISYIAILLYCYIAASPVLANGWEKEKPPDLGPPAAEFKHLDIYLTNFLNTATSLAVVAVFVMLLYGGFQYLTAGGDPKAMEAGKNTITYAILGLVLMIGAWFILRLIETFTGVTVTKFSIPFPSP